MYRLKIIYFYDDLWQTRWQNRCFAEIPEIDKSIDMFNPDINCGSANLELIYDKNSDKDWDVFVRNTFQYWEYIELWYNEELLFDGKLEIDSSFSNNVLSMRLIGRFAEMADFDVDFNKTLDDRLTFTQVFWSYVSQLSGVFIEYSPLGGILDWITSSVPEHRTDFSFKHEGSMFEGLKKVAYMAGGRFFIENSTVYFTKIDKENPITPDGKLIEMGYSWKNIETLAIDLGEVSLLRHPDCRVLDVTAYADAYLENDWVLEDSEGNQWKICGMGPLYERDLERYPNPNPTIEQGYLFPSDKKLYRESFEFTFINVVYDYAGGTTNYDSGFISRYLENRFMNAERYKEYTFEGINSNIIQGKYFENKGRIFYCFDVNRDKTIDKVEILAWEI